MSDGPSKLVPQEPLALDELILEGEDETVAAPPPVAVPSQPPTSQSSLALERKDRPSSRVRAEVPKAVGDTQGRKKAKITLRIPDDQVGRPHSAPPGSGTPASGVPSVRIPSEHRIAARRPMTGPPPPMYAVDPSDVEITRPRPRDEVRARLAAITGEAAALGPSAAGIDAAQEPGWTPFQPEVGEETTRIQPTPTFDANGSTRPREPSGAPSSDDIPIDMDLSGMGSIPDASSEEFVTVPRLDSQEIPIDDSDRLTETGEVEVEAEDLVSVESLPAPSYPPPSAGRTVGKYPAFKEPEGITPTPQGPTAASLMSSITPSPSPSQPSIDLAVTPVTPPVAAVVQPTTPQAPSVASGPVSVPMAKRSQSSLVFVPPVGGLAPPPMTETSAAARKKVRPWWEELFNDDFIRTMAKVSDKQINAEVNFIEESLGCEAGAMILDLACGTGRHAVELAARGYQVVGYDLSLAMLARASDEAQDRKQKINFVQGDMREMTFEETFDGIYSWNTSFGYFDEEKNAAVIGRVHKALKKGGQFLLDVVNRDYIIRQAPSLAWFQGDGCICMDEMGIDFITSRMRVKRTLMMDDGRTKEIEYSMRIYALHELGKMLHDNGFRVAEVSGRTGTPGVFFGCEAPRTLILAEKR